MTLFLLVTLQHCAMCILFYVIKLFVRTLVLHRVADSCLVIPVHQELSDNDKFTIAAWFQSLTVGGTMSGTVLSLSSSSANTSLISYSLGFFQLHNGTTAVKFSLQVMIVVSVMIMIQ